MPIVQSYSIYLIKYVKIKIYSFILEKKHHTPFRYDCIAVEKKSSLVN